MAPSGTASLSLRVPDWICFSPGDAAARLKELAAQSADNDASERSSFRSWLPGFRDALGVDDPVPPTAGYCFELPIHVDRQGRIGGTLTPAGGAGGHPTENEAIRQAVTMLT